jgi:hypothetical protein
MKLDPSKTIPTASSKPENWIQWHKDLKKMFGKKKANSIWVFAWGKRGAIDSHSNTYDLRSYMNGQGVDISTTGWKEIGDSYLNFTNWTWGVSKGFLVGTGVLVSLILIAILVKLFRNPNQKLNVTALPIPMPSQAPQPK